MITKVTNTFTALLARATECATTYNAASKGLFIAMTEFTFHCLNSDSETNTMIIKVQERGNNSYSLIKDGENCGSVTAYLGLEKKNQSLANTAILSAYYLHVVKTQGSLAKDVDVASVMAKGLGETSVNALRGQNVKAAMQSAIVRGEKVGAVASRKNIQTAIDADDNTTRPARIAGTGTTTLTGYDAIVEKINRLTDDLCELVDASNARFVTAVDTDVANLTASARRLALVVDAIEL